MTAIVPAVISWTTCCWCSAACAPERGKRAALGAVQRLVRKVRLFGLHLVPLEVREDASLHAAALDEILRYCGITDTFRALPGRREASAAVAGDRQSQAALPDRYQCLQRDDAEHYPHLADDRQGAPTL